MGYSCSALASFTLDGLMANVSHVNNIANVWFHKNVCYMYERGKEQSDGSITGTIYKFIDSSLTAMNKVGSFKIASDGRIIRFGGMSHNAKNSAEVWSASKYIKTFGFPQKHTISAKHPAYNILCNSPFVIV